MSGRAGGTSQPLCPQSPLGLHHTATRGTVRQNSLAGLGWQEGAVLFTGQSHTRRFRCPRRQPKRLTAEVRILTKATNKKATGLRNEGPPAKTALCERSLSPRQICGVETVLGWGFSNTPLCRCVWNLLG